VNTKSKFYNLKLSKVWDKKSKQENDAWIEFLTWWWTTEHNRATSIISADIRIFHAGKWFILHQVMQTIFSKLKGFIFAEQKNRI
jgi:hypothetical protein